MTCTKVHQFGFVLRATTTTIKWANWYNLTLSASYSMYTSHYACMPYWVSGFLYKWRCVSTHTANNFMLTRSHHFMGRFYLPSQMSEILTSISRIIEPIGLTRHICTYLNAFLRVNPNIVIIFNNFEFFENCAKFGRCCLLMHAVIP